MPLRSSVPVKPAMRLSPVYGSERRVRCSKGSLTGSSNSYRYCISYIHDYIIHPTLVSPILDPQHLLGEKAIRIIVTTQVLETAYRCCISYIHDFIIRPSLVSPIFDSQHLLGEKAIRMIVTIQVLETASPDDFAHPPSAFNVTSINLMTTSITSAA